MGDRIKIADVEAQVGVLERLAPGPCSFRTVRALLRLARAADEQRTAQHAWKLALARDADEPERMACLRRCEESAAGLDAALEAVDFEP